MENISGINEDELCWEISKNGITLKVISTKIGEGEWQLVILNEQGVSSNWLEFFSTAQLAMEAGIEAIEKEGVKTFVNIEGYEYLNE